MQSRAEGVTAWEMPEILIVFRNVNVCFRNVIYSKPDYHGTMHLYRAQRRVSELEKQLYESKETLMNAAEDLRIMVRYAKISGTNRGGRG